MALGGVTVWRSAYGGAISWATVTSGTTMRARIDRGATDLTQQPTRGTAEIVLVDDGTWWDTPPFAVGEWFRLSGTDHLGGEQVLFVGRVESYSDGNDPRTGLSTHTIRAVDQLADLGASEISPRAPVGSGDAPGTRIARILDAHGFTIASRSLDAGVQTLLPIDYSQTALVDIHGAANSDLGRFFIDRFGTVRYAQDIALVNTAAPASSATIGDDASDLTLDARWSAYDRIHGRQLVANYVTATLYDGSDSAIGVSASSQALYDARKVRPRGLWHDDHNDLQNFAAYLADWRGQMVDQYLVTVPCWRGNAPGDAPSWFANMAGLELYDVVTIERDYGTTPESVDCWLDRLEWSWDPDAKWGLRFHATPAYDVAPSNLIIDNNSFTEPTATGLNTADSRLTA